jgi:hypothetical protein
VARNVSRGTPEEMISLFKQLMRCDLVHYHEAYPGVALLQALNAEPYVSLAGVRQAMETIKPAGVRLDLSYAKADGFGFEDDPDASGFGDLDDPAIGGEFATSF